jgi:hypothetical protein
MGISGWTLVNNGSLLMILEPTRPIRNFIGFLFLFMASFGNAYALDQGYLDAVRADVKEFSTHEFEAPADSVWLGGEENQSPQLTDLNGFSDFVRTKSPGSYIFYKKLTDEYKKKLHQDYLSTGDIHRLKQDIFKYTREMKQKTRSSHYSN